MHPVQTPNLIIESAIGTPSRDELRSCSIHSPLLDFHIIPMSITITNFAPLIIWKPAEIDILVLEYLVLVLGMIS